MGTLQDGNGTIDFEELCILEIKMSGARPRADLIAPLSLKMRQMHRNCWQPEIRYSSTLEMVSARVARPIETFYVSTAAQMIFQQ